MVAADVDRDARSDAVTESLFTQSEFRSRLDDLPPSAKLVAKVLDVDAPLDQAQLAEETLLPDRTVRYALNQLQEVNLVSARVNLKDARKHVYELQTPH
ncbi:MarR family transcriptional regulator [Halomicrococcus sp. NG-SE-24]|uniref:MarR family transcriptional regulator n=1 Tax=Halomicrococcus sp. NG-SE-24 TaxID=3436928 RepID=UPI003D97EE6C